MNEKDAIKARGWDLAQIVLAQAGAGEFRPQGNQAYFRVPWRDDENASLAVTMGTDGKEGGMWVDRGMSGEGGDILHLCGRLWGLAVREKKPFQEILNRCCDLLGIPRQEKPKSIQVEARDVVLDDLLGLCRMYGLEPLDFDAAGCIHPTKAWFPSLGKDENSKYAGTQQPAIQYPGITEKWQPIKKFKSLLRYERDGAVEKIAIPPTGKRHSSGKGTGFFPAKEFDTAPDKPFLVLTGGEEKALAAIKAGFRAVSFTHGEKPVSVALARFLAAFGWVEIVLAYDADPAGWKAVRECAPVLMGAGINKLRAVKWPDGTAGKSDLCDVLREGGVEAVRNLIDSAPVIDGVLPQIQINDRQARDIFADAWRVLHASNHGPEVFQRAGTIVMRKNVSTNGKQEHVINMVGTSELYGRLCRIADWVSITENKSGRITQSARPPRDVAEDMMVYPAVELPTLESIITSPVYGREGTLLEAPGYHAADSTWLEDSGLKLDSIPVHPTVDQISDAKGLFFDAFTDFPWVSDTDRAHAIAAVLLPFCRRLIAGCTPLHLITSPTPGSGKSLLAAAIAKITTGEASDARSYPDNEEERRKFVTAELMKGSAVLLLDNASPARMLNSPTLAAVLTTDIWSDRLLGTNKMVSVANVATWLMTANNPSLSMELTRRAIQIRIDPKRDQPWLRGGFKHDPLTRWIDENRPKLVSAALTLIQAWIVADRPAGKAALGSFERWASTMGGILEVAGIGGFLGNLQALYANADTEGSMWRNFIESWANNFGDQAMKPGDLADFCVKNELMDSILGDGASDRGRSIKLGKALNRAVDRTFGEWSIQRFKDRNGPTFALRNVVKYPANIPHSQDEQNQLFAGCAGSAGYSDDSMRGRAPVQYAHTGAGAGAQACESASNIPHFPHIPQDFGNNQFTDAGYQPPFIPDIPQHSAGRSGYVTGEI